MNRSMRALGLLLAAAGVVGCRELGIDDPGERDPFEAASFLYVYAVPSTQGGYIVTRPNDTACPGVPADISLTLLATVTQARSDFYGAMVSCGGTFLVGGQEVRDVRDNGLFFDYRITGGQNDAVIRINRLTVPESTVIDPSGMTLTTTGGLSVGQPTTDGYAEVSFINPNKVFTCAYGGPVWSQNTNVAGATFFEIELTEQDGEHVEGEFLCIARNQTDPGDDRLLLILDGAFTMVPR